MSSIEYHRLRVLIADDFSNFRSIVYAMLGKLGIEQVAIASSGQDVVDLCGKEHFDLILCDYDLGQGKNGQQVLEELRFRQLIAHQTLFVIVSADATKDVVMATYECAPDDYLMKPITAHMLHQRIQRVLASRHILMPVYNALDQQDNALAIQLLTELAASAGRVAVAAQKLLGELFINEGELAKAERIYASVLQVRPLDWARLGLARVKQARGDLERAREFLEIIVQDNPLYLPAYDCLAHNWEAMGEHQQVQTAIQRSVDISPKSILRHKRLAQVAENNGDLAAAINALRHTVKLGELSCHADAEDNLGFARLAVKMIESKLEPPSPLGSETITVLHNAEQRFALDEHQRLRASLLEGRSRLCLGDDTLATDLIEGAEAATDARAPLAVNIDRILALRSIGAHERADRLTDQCLAMYEDDQQALEQLDKVLEEPASDRNRKMVATVNREGIDLYNQSRYDEAVACFERASRHFPKHIGIQLNIAQALIGKLRSGKSDAVTLHMTQQQLANLDSLIQPNHPQFQRFRRLQDMAKLKIAN